MALKLQLTDERGIITRWHKLTDCHVTWPTLRGTDPHLSVIVRSYVNQAQRDQEAVEGGDRAVRTSSYDLPMPDQISASGLYTALKLLPEWAGATDC